MKTLIALLLMCSTCWGAEFLINNRESHGMDEKGDIVAVRADGYEWSESELPKVVKIKGMKYEDAVIYEQSLNKDKEVIIDGKPEMRPEMVKKRKYKISAMLFTGSQLDTSKTSSFKTTDISEKTIVIPK